MIIALNGYELPRRADGDQTVGQVLDELRAEIQDAGKVVTYVALDGKPLTQNWQRRRELNASVRQVNRLDLTVEEPASIAQRTASDTILLANRLAVCSQPLAHKFRVNDEVVANNELAAFLDDLKLVASGVDYLTRSAEGEVNRERRRRVLDTANQLVPTLDRLYRAQAAGDYVTIADELEYELPNQINQWVNILSESSKDEEVKVK